MYLAQAFEPQKSVRVVQRCLIIVPLLFLVFKTINYAGNDDLIPLFPFVGVFVGYVFIVKNQNPKVISISRIRNVGARDELLDWAATQYDRFPVDFAHNSVYVRRVP